jgi:hypothetical protein
VIGHRAVHGPGRGRARRRGRPPGRPGDRARTDPGRWPAPAGVEPSGTTGPRPRGRSGARRRRRRPARCARTPAPGVATEGSPVAAAASHSAPSTRTSALDRMTADHQRGS